MAELRRRGILGLLLGAPVAARAIAATPTPPVVIEAIPEAAAALPAAPQSLGRIARLSSYATMGFSGTYAAVSAYAVNSRLTDPEAWFADDPDNRRDDTYDETDFTENDDDE